MSIIPPLPLSTKISSWSGDSDLPITRREAFLEVVQGRAYDHQSAQDFAEDSSSQQTIILLTHMLVALYGLCCWNYPQFCTLRKISVLHSQSQRHLFQSWIIFIQSMVSTVLLYRSLLTVNIHNIKPQHTLVTSLLHNVCKDSRKLRNTHRLWFPTTHWNITRM